MIKTPIRLYIIITVLAAIWCAGILAAPMLRHTGCNYCSEAIYSFFSRTCHQDNARSFYIEGEKYGVCVRCSAIYFGFLAGLLLYPMFGLFKLNRIPNRKFFFFAVLPMLADVILNDFGLHASTTLTRAATGVLFGCAMSCWVIPLFIEACLQLVRRKKIHSPEYGENNYVRETQ